MGSLAPTADRLRSAGATPARERPGFSPDDGFHRELRRRVGRHFGSHGRSRHGGVALYVKSAVLLTSLSSSYVVLAFVATTAWSAVPAAVVLALSVAGIGFCIQHDANHGAYSARPGLNRLMGATLDLLGGSSYLWRWKHNVAHHTYTNLAGVDDDIDVVPFARLAPAQPRRGAHRLQHLYMWALYGLLLLRWNYVSDFLELGRGRVARTRVPWPPPGELALLAGGKLVFLGWSLVLPAIFHPLPLVIAVHLGVSALVGLVSSTVFQLAHCVEEAEFPVPSPGTGRLDDGWAAHQVATSVDFAPRSRWLTWYLGGLNFQVEHHLFPRVSHVHYPQLAPIVQDVCRQFGVRYRVHERLTDALASHARWLRRMGREAPGASAPSRG